MNLVIGLGNPGEKFENNRHNAGFLFLDFWNEKNDRNEFSYDKKSDCLILKNQGNLFCKPQGFMNNSGECVRKLVSFYKNKFNKKTLIYDDLDLEFGEFKIGTKGPRVHNGVNSVINSCGEDFVHIRIGIRGEEYQKIKNSGKSIADNYILKDFNKKEKEKLEEIFESIYVEVNKND